MTFEELNVVRKLKKRIADESKKLKALQIVIGAFPHKYGKTESGGSSGNVAKSPFEGFVIEAQECEENIKRLQFQLREEVPKLTTKIQENFSDSTEQTLLLYRYVACKFFKEISFLMGYSESKIYKLHKLILKNTVEYSLKQLQTVD